MCGWNNIVEESRKKLNVCRTSGGTVIVGSDEEIEVNSLCYVGENIRNPSKRKLARSEHMDRNSWEAYATQSAFWPSFIHSSKSPWPYPKSTHAFRCPTIGENPATRLSQRHCNIGNSHVGLFPGSQDCTNSQSSLRLTSSDVGGERKVRYARAARHSP
jgi:hypothetical protein